MKTLDVKYSVDNRLPASAGFGILASSKAFRAISSGIYNDKILAVIRELSTNAVDSHTVAGCADKPFDVFLPTILDQNFYIRDYGTGLSKKDLGVERDANGKFIPGIYTTYFQSNKTDSNELVGCLGLGSKSPFCYVENFTIDSYFNGMHFTCIAFINCLGEPELSLASEEKTNEPNGIKVSFAVNDSVVYKETVLNSEMSRRMIRLVRDGYPVSNLFRFVDRLMGNVSRNSIEQLYLFLEFTGCPITDRGTFLAYKTLRDNFHDKWTGTIDNSVGREVSMPRNEVDDNPKNTCSVGLHVGGLAYSGPDGWYHTPGEPIVICEVDPVDVVCVPDYFSHHKMRVCKYKVVAPYESELNSSVYRSEDKLVSVQPTEEVDIEETVDAEETIYGDMVTFWYKNKTNSDEGQRYVSITDFSYDDDGKIRSIIGTLLHPEKNKGLTRCFTVANMSNIRWLN